MNEINAGMNTVWGRAASIVLGLVLMGIGIGVLGATPAGIALVVVGLVPIVMGAWGHCLVEALTPRHAI
ncbi:MAG TPA: YgaP-like transmembrane domain [Chloroflexota bacterium]|nr:YgaP-like transmembrane domain [Chloroflexota bacterium]